MPVVKLIILGADALIAYGSRAKEYLLNMGAKEKDVFVYNHSTDVGNFKSINTRRIRESKNILYYGQLIERKGVDILIKAVARLNSVYKSIKLVVVGSGQFDNNLHDLAEGLGMDNVFFKDDPGDDKMSKYFKEADLLVLPSREEVWGLVVNMALANGVPVIASNVVGSSPDIIKEGVNGYTFKSGSVDDLYNKLLAFFKNNKNRVKMTSQSYRIISEYTPEVSARLVNKAVKHALR